MCYGATRIASKIKWWLFGPKRKLCHAFCPFCKFYDLCKQDVEEFNTIYAEVYGEKGWE